MREDPDHVPQLQHHLPVGKQLAVAAAHERDHLTETLVVVQLTDGAPDRLRARDEDAPVLVLGTVKPKALLAPALTEHRRELFDLLRQARHHDQVPRLQHGGGTGVKELAGALDPAEDHLAVV